MTPTESIYHESDNSMHPFEWLVKTSSYQGNSDNWFATEKEAEKKYWEWYSYEGQLQAHTEKPQFVKKEPIECARPHNWIDQKEYFEGKDYELKKIPLKTPKYFVSGQEGNIRQSEVDHKGNYFFWQAVAASPLPSNEDDVPEDVQEELWQWVYDICERLYRKDAVPDLQSKFHITRKTVSPNE